MSGAPRPDTGGWLAARLPAPPAVLGDRLARRADAPEAPGPVDGGPAAAAFAAPPADLGPVSVELARRAAAILAGLCREPHAPGAKELADAGGVAEWRRLRERAFVLLEADALLTYAFEAAAEEGPDAVLATAAWLSPARLAALLPERAAA